MCDPRFENGFLVAAFWNPLAARMGDAQSRLVEQERLRRLVAIHQHRELQPEYLNGLVLGLRRRKLEPRRGRDPVVVMARAAFGFFEYGVDLLDKEALVNTRGSKLRRRQYEERQCAEPFYVMQCSHSGYYLTHLARTPAPPASQPAPWRSGYDPS